MLRNCSFPFRRTRILLPNRSRRRFHRSGSLHQEPRVNPVGIQYLSNELHNKVFPKISSDEYKNPRNPKLLSLAKDHLANANLLGKKTMITDPITIPNFPELVGSNTLDEHFSRIGSRISKPYVELAESLLGNDKTLPPIPQKWEFQLGWTRYAPGKNPERVEYPLEDGLVFDVEVLYKISHYPVMATAASAEAWYAWVSPILTNHKDAEISNFQNLIPMATQTKPKLLVGYNVSYDRARVLEEYNIKQSKAFFLDAMALHISMSGFCSQQRPLWHAHRKHKSSVKSESAAEELDLDANYEDESLDSETTTFSPQDIAQEIMDDPWLNKGSTNSLASAAEFHCGIKMDKDARDLFSSTSVDPILENFQNLLTYCATDVDVTFKVAQKLYPQFREKNPHPVSFAALKLLGTLFCPTTTKWQQYLDSAESIYQENRNKVNTILQERAQELVEFIETQDVSKKPNIEKDPWLMHLNWNIKLPRIRKDGTPYAKQAFLTGYPEWYRELFKSVKDENGEMQRDMNLSVRTRVTPYLLRLKWEGYPLVWTNTTGWCFKVPSNDLEIDKLIEKKYIKVIMDPENYEDVYSLLREGDRAYELFRVPHPEGPKRRCTSIMTKSYLKYFESGELSSEYEYASEILNLNATASYWMGNRARIMDQFVVYADPEGKKNQFFNTKAEMRANEGMGMIIPKFCTMGTVTRRATENTWLTASNSKSNRIGSELKAMITSPKDYVFVGADVDSEELWIASLIGDSMFQLHGATALGWMTLEGDKNEKTDLHSRTADIMGILRNDAKIFNYGRIYGAGVKFATQLLQKCSANLSDDEAATKAQELYKQTKGLSSYSKFLERRMYHGGTESVMFNALESIAQLENPRTPVLGASITDALTRQYLNKNNYLTSRVNWAIQSSGVDYLHLLIVSMEYLIEKYAIDARLMITVHDELRYMVRKDQSLMCAMLLQISNLWTRAMFCEQLGIKDVPQSCAFFSEVDIDHVLRKEVGMNCVTPSHPESIPPGESYTINKLLNSFDVGDFLGGKQKTLNHLKSQKFTPRLPVMDEFDADEDEEAKVDKLRLQTSVDKAEWAKLMSLYLKRKKQLSLLAPSVNLTGSVKRSPRKKLTTKDSDLGSHEVDMKSEMAPSSKLVPKSANKTSASKPSAKQASELTTKLKKRVTKKASTVDLGPTKPPTSTLKTTKRKKHPEETSAASAASVTSSSDDRKYDVITKEGDDLLLAELKRAGAGMNSFDKEATSSSNFNKSTIRQKPFSRSYSQGKTYDARSSQSVNNEYLGTLFANSNPKTFTKEVTQHSAAQEAYSIKPDSNAVETARTSSTIRGSKFPRVKVSKRSRKLTKPITQHPIVSSIAFKAEDIIDNFSADENFRRRRDGAVYESEYRFGRGYRR